MGIFNRLFSQRRTPEPTNMENLWNPNGVDRLLNEELHCAIEAFTAEPTVENRRNFYLLLSTSNYCVPSSNNDAGGTTITASQNEQGELTLVAFSDPCALKRWQPNSPEFLVFTASKLFETILEYGIMEVIINPAGPAGGKLTRADVELMAQGKLPIGVKVLNCWEDLAKFFKSKVLCFVKD
ncbi:MAG: SseB family protein [Zavarzinella sp.]